MTCGKYHVFQGSGSPGTCNTASLPVILIKVRKKKSVQEDVKLRDMNYWTHEASESVIRSFKSFFSSNYCPILNVAITCIASHSQAKNGFFLNTEECLRNVSYTKRVLFSILRTLVQAWVQGMREGGRERGREGTLR